MTKPQKSFRDALEQERQDSAAGFFTKPEEREKEARKAAAPGPAKKDARLNLNLKSGSKIALKKIANAKETTPNAIIQQLIDDYIEENRALLEAFDKLKGVSDHGNI